MRLTNCLQMIHGSADAFMLRLHFAGWMMDGGLRSIMNHISVLPVTVEASETKPGFRRILMYMRWIIPPACDGLT